MNHLTWELDLLYSLGVPNARSAFQYIVTYQLAVAENDKRFGFKLRLVCLDLSLDWMKERTNEKMNRWIDVTYFWPMIVDRAQAIARTYPR